MTRNSSGKRKKNSGNPLEPPVPTPGITSEEIVSSDIVAERNSEEKELDKLVAYITGIGSKSDPTGKKSVPTEEELEQNRKRIAEQDGAARNTFRESVDENFKEYMRKSREELEIKLELERLKAAERFRELYDQRSAGLKTPDQGKTSMGSSAYEDANSSPLSEQDERGYQQDSQVMRILENISERLSDNSRVQDDMNQRLGYIEHNVMFAEKQITDIELKLQKQNVVKSRSIEQNIPVFNGLPGDYAIPVEDPPTRSPKSSDDILRDIYALNKKKNDRKINEDEFTYLKQNNAESVFGSFNPTVVSGQRSIDMDDHEVEDNNPFVNARVDNASRRLSWERAIPVSNNTPTKPAATLVITPYVIQEDMKMKYITLPSLKRLLEQYALFKASTYDNTKSLIFFINSDCQMKLVIKQKKLYSPLHQEGLTLQNIFLLKDKHTEDMISDYIRPTSRDDFIVKFDDAMTKPPWSKDQEFSVASYETDIFPHIVIFLEETETYNHYLRRGAAAHELEYMPKMEWGKNTPSGSGMFRIAMENLNNKHFVTLLKEENLKLITSMKDFISYFSAKNIELCKMSRDFKRQNTLLKEPEDYKTIAASSRKKADEYKQYKSRSSRSTPTKAPREKLTRYVRNRLNELIPVEFDAPEEGESVSINSEDEEDKMSEEEWNEKYDTRKQHQQEVARDIRDWTNAEADLAFNALCAIDPVYAAKRNKDGIKIYKDKPVDTKEQPCFQYAFGNCVAGKECVYSHESEKIKKFLKNQYERLVSAPAWDQKLVTDVNTSRNSGGSGFDRRNATGKSNNGGSHGSGAFQSPSTHQKNTTYSNNYSKNLRIIEVDDSNENTEGLPGTVANQPASTEKSGVSRDPPPTGGRENPDL